MHTRLKRCKRLLTVNHDNAVKYQGSTIRYSISIGVAQLVPNDRECDDLCHRCDKALYAAKKGGRNCIVIDRDSIQQEKVDTVRNNQKGAKEKEIKIA